MVENLSWFRCSKYLESRVSAVDPAVEPTYGLAACSSRRVLPRPREYPCPPFESAALGKVRGVLHLVSPCSSDLPWRNNKIVLEQNFNDQGPAETSPTCEQDIARHLWSTLRVGKFQENNSADIPHNEAFRSSSLRSTCAANREVSRHRAHLRRAHFHFQSALLLCEPVHRYK